MQLPTLTQHTKSAHKNKFIKSYLTLAVNFKRTLRHILSCILIQQLANNTETIAVCMHIFIFMCVFHAALSPLHFHVGCVFSLRRSCFRLFLRENSRFNLLKMNYWCTCRPYKRLGRAVCMCVFVLITPFSRSRHQQCQRCKIHYSLSAHLEVYFGLDKCSR